MNKFKVTNSGEKVSAFGGFNFVFNSFRQSGISELIDRELGQRVKTVGFQYSDIFVNHLSVFFNGGDCTEDLSEHLKEDLLLVMGMNVCSPDTVLRAGKELSCPSKVSVNPVTGVVHEFNINLKLNDLMIKSMLVTGQLETGKKYDLDYDNVVLPNEKYDSKNTYKKTNGYQPGVATIGNLPVYIEGRNGNSPAKYQQDKTISRAFGIFGSNGISIGRFRADSASYQQSVIEEVEKNADTFYIRAQRCAAMEERIMGLSGWQKIRLGVQEMEVVDIDDYMPFSGNQKYRLVISRIRRKDKQTDIFSGEAYTYRAIITNDREMGNREIVSFYNARGESEKVFDVMNNDFGWSKMPYSFLSENTAFMIMTAIYANFYSYIIVQYSKKLTWLKSNFRIKKFIFRFITVAAKWIRTGRRHVLKLYTEKNYRPLLT
jgi:hypothetical protein